MQISGSGIAVKILAVLGLTAVFASAPTVSAEAGIFRFLLGGGGAQDHRRDWSQVTSRQEIPFSSRYETGTVIVSFADRRLYFVHKKGAALSYLIGTPVLEEKWQGVLNVSDKRQHPRWVPTADMRKKDPTLPIAVPGGHPRNPLGPRALYLGDTLYRIHGTDAPWTVGHEVSNGCVRLYNRDILDLYERVPVGAKVIVTWDRFQVASGARRHREAQSEPLPWNRF